MRNDMAARCLELSSPMCLCGRLIYMLKDIKQLDNTFYKACFAS